MTLGEDLAKPDWKISDHIGDKQPEGFAPRGRNWILRHRNNSSFVEQTELDSHNGKTSL